MKTANSVLDYFDRLPTGRTRVRTETLHAELKAEGSSGETDHERVERWADAHGLKAERDVIRAEYLFTKKA